MDQPNEGKEQTSAQAEKESQANRLDPFFKTITNIVAEKVGLIAEPTEQIFSPRADGVYNVPSEISLAETLFDFFARVNVVEFKSENDPFTYNEYVLNETRTDIRYLNGKEKNIEDFLNVFVLSRLPRAFLTYAASRRIYFEKDPARPWLYQAAVGFQNVVLVICRLLPLEPRYYPWLSFAPSGSVAWREYFWQIMRERNQQYLDLAKDVYPEEVNKMLTDEEFQAKLKAIVEDPAFKNVGHKRDIVLNAVVALEELDEDYPVGVEEALARALKPEQRLKGLKPQERLEGLTAEEKAALLKLLQQETSGESN